jgi:hypothetical protein
MKAIARRLRAIRLGPLGVLGLVCPDLEQKQ